MEEIVKLVAEKTGVSEEIASEVANSVIDILKDRLPDPIASQIDSLLSGTDNQMMDTLTSKGLTGLFGDK